MRLLAQVYPEHDWTADNAAFLKSSSASGKKSQFLLKSALKAFSKEGKSSLFDNGFICYL
jgi:hypothetical protein